LIWFCDRRALAPSFTTMLEKLRYVLTSAASYVFILGAMFVLVDWLTLNKVVAYVLVYLAAYAFEYYATLRLVFRSDHSHRKVLKFLIYVGSFLTLNTWVYKLLLALELHYLVATVATAALLMPLRFVVNKYWVYRD
jgi:putative flippase GtrA